MAEIQKSGLGLGLGLEPRPERDLATVINEDQPLDLQVVESGGGGLNAGCLDALILNIGVTEDELRAQCLSAQAKILRVVNGVTNHPTLEGPKEKSLSDFSITEQELQRSFTVLEAGTPLLGVKPRDTWESLRGYASIIARFTGTEKTNVPIPVEENFGALANRYKDMLEGLE